MTNKEVGNRTAKAVAAEKFGAPMGVGMGMLVAAQNSKNVIHAVVNQAQRVLYNLQRIIEQNDEIIAQNDRMLEYAAWFAAAQHAHDSAA